MNEKYVLHELRRLESYRNIGDSCILLKKNKRVCISRNVGKLKVLTLKNICKNRSNNKDELNKNYNQL